MVQYDSEKALGLFATKSSHVPALEAQELELQTEPAQSPPITMISVALSYDENQTHKRCCQKQSEGP
jgi:hypothetical protein